MAWLSELVESSEDSLEALPVPCLCEFLLANQMQDGELEGGAEEAGPSGERLGHREKYRRKKAGRTKVGGVGVGPKRVRWGLDLRRWGGGGTKEGEVGVGPKEVGWGKDQRG